MADQFWLSDGQWAVIEPLLPQLGGKPRVDDRRVISGILHRYREGLRWRAVPAEYGPRTTLFKPFRPLEREGHLARIAGCPRSLRRAAGLCHGRQLGRARASLGRGRKRGQQNQAIGRSRGGPTTKIHALADGAGRLYALMLTAGQVHDIHGGRALLASVPPMRWLVADKAYDATDLRDFLAEQGTEAVISPNPRRLVRPAFDTIAYRARNLIERAFCRLKDWRAIATRYDKTARNFLAGVCLAVLVTDWLQ